MATSNEPTPVIAHLKRRAPDAVVKVDLDERAFVFPAGRHVSQLQFLAYRPHMIAIEAVYSFNESKASPQLIELPIEDARQFCRKLVESVYRAQPSQVVSRETTLVLSTVANGYIIEFGSHECPLTLMLSTGCIWRVSQGLARVIDVISPIAAN